MAKIPVISALLLLITITVVKSEPDTVSMSPVVALRKPVVSPLSRTPNGNDSLAEMGSNQINKSANNNNITPHHQSFYKNLEKAAKRSNITKWLHELIINDPGVVYMPSDQPYRAETFFTAYEGKTIMNIGFHTASLFAPSIEEIQYSTHSKLERIGRLLHFSTSELVIRNNLLFKSGENLDPFLMADNERLLRQLSYLEDARILIFENAINPEGVDVLVITQDRWARGFDMNFSEIDRGEFEFYNKNVLGLGQEFGLNLLFNAAEDNNIGFRTGIKLNNIGRTFLNSGVSYRNAFGNTVLNLSSGRNFITPSMKYAGGLAFTSSKLIDDYVFPDSSFLNQRLDFNVYDYWFGRSFQLQDRNEKRNNLFITTRYNRNIFYNRPEIGENIRYQFHNRDIFLLGLTYTSLGYLKSSYIYGFGPTEDIPLGFKFETIAGYEDNQFYPRWYGSLNLSRSNYFNRVAYLQNNVSLGGFLNDGSFEQGILKLESTGFSSLISVNGHYMRQFFHLNFTRGFARFEDELISISNMYGIRGLRSERLTGTRKLILQAETMFYSKRNWYGFRYALYSMVDLGWIGTGSNLIRSEGFYGGLGAGMRVRNEHLVFPTVNFRLAWFPRIPEPASAKFFYIMSERNNIFDEFRITAPDILPYR